MLSKEEVKKIYNLVDKCHNNINDIFGVSKSDHEDDQLEVRDWVNEDLYPDKKMAEFNKNEIQFFFESYNLYFRIFIRETVVMIDYVGNEFSGERYVYYPHNGNISDIEKSIMVGLELLVEKMKRYREYSEFDISPDSLEYKERERNILLNMVSDD